MMKLFKACKYNSLKPTIFQKHRNDLAIMTSNSLNETHRERHVQLLGGKGKRFIWKINRKWTSHYMQLSCCYDKL